MPLTAMASNTSVCLRLPFYVRSPVDRRPILRHISFSLLASGSEPETRESTEEWWKRLDDVWKMDEVKRASCLKGAVRKMNSSSKALHTDRKTIK